MSSNIKSNKNKKKHGATFPTLIGVSTAFIIAGTIYTKLESNRLEKQYRIKGE
jgi:hypothetical protein